MKPEHKQHILTLMYGKYDHPATVVESLAPATFYAYHTTIAKDDIEFFAAVRNTLRIYGMTSTQHVDDTRN